MNKLFAIIAFGIILFVILLLVLPIILSERAERLPSFDSPKEILYSGHTYLVFGAGPNRWGTHDANCPCYKKGNK